MAVVGQVSQQARAENIARDDLRAALAGLVPLTSWDQRTEAKINEWLNALDRYIEAKLQPRRY